MGRSGFLLFVLIAFCVIGCTSSEDDVLYIATAANVQFAMDDLTAMFSEETGIPCEIILGSSGKLMAQIREGAPYHVFVSADMKYPVTLFNDGLTTARPDIYANGSLVLWTLDDRLPSIEILRSGEVSKIALANPSTAPYGRAASQALEFYGMDMEVADKLVYGESISQTNQFIISGSAQVGFTAKSVVMSPDWKSKGNWVEIEKAAYDPIEQGVVVINSMPEKTDEAEQFRQFLLSDRAAVVLEKYGYQVNR